MEDIQEFRAFVDEGIEYLDKEGATGREAKNSYDVVELSPDKIQLLREVKIDLEGMTDIFREHLDGQVTFVQGHDDPKNFIY